MNWNALGILLFTTGVIFSGVFHYYLGFFLTRYEITNISQKHEFQPPPQFQKAIVLIVDALRYDFAHYDASSSYYSNKLKVFNETLESEPQQSLLFELVADPPTVTMQRIKGITTGSLPTFIDFKDNFHSYQVEEDNLLVQLRNKTVVFMGDDTWLGLYPSHFARAFPFESFNVKDLHTVDNGVISHMQSELRSDWDLIIGHMLGVDHVGHRYYANHPEMEKKLLQVDSFIRSIKAEMDQETVLMVFGDHGMTDDGNHGGTTKKETNSALFVYSKKPFNNQWKTRSVLKQIDLVPTISLLLGVGIPFNNLGSLIPEMFLESSYLENATYVNALQVKEYLSTYDKLVKKLPDPLYDNLEIDFEQLEKKYLEGNTDLEGFIEYINRAADMCRSIWTTFDTRNMTVGLLVLSLAVAANIVFTFAGVENLNLLWVVASALGYFVSPVLSGVLLFVCILRNKKPLEPSRDLFLVVGIQALHGYGLFSNSYILKEDQVIRFLLQVLLGYIASYNPKATKNLLVAAFAVRFSASLDIITQKEMIDHLSSFDKLLMNPVVCTYLPIAVFLVVVFSKLEVNLKVLGFSANVLVVASFWALQDTYILNENSVWIKAYLPRISYCLSGVLMLGKDPLYFLLGVSPSLLLILGYQSPLVVLCFFVQVYFFEKAQFPKNGPVVGLFYALAVFQYFYVTGHRCNFPSLQVAAAFVGFETFNFYISGVLMLFNTFGVFFALFGINVVHSPQTQVEAFKYVTKFFFVNLLLTTLNTAVNRRHLMVWPIFAPKFIFDFFICMFVVVVSSTGLGCFYRGVRREAKCR